MRIKRPEPQGKPTIGFKMARWNPKDFSVSSGSFVIFNNDVCVSIMLNMENYDYKIDALELENMFVLP